MNTLLIYPEYPDTFWGFKHALRFILKKANVPPLGLLTVAALLPKDWTLRLVDLNLKKLKEKDIAWADMVLISAMDAQRPSVQRIVDLCQKYRVRTVAGGPLFSANPQDFPGIDHLVLKEAEITLPLFLADLEKGQPQHIYTTDQWADLSKSPRPMWELADIKKYSSMNLQYSRGCPYNCDFCDISILYGRIPRTKSTRQVLGELEALHKMGWRGGVFIVDDNFVGNKARLKAEVLPQMVAWMDVHKHPFTFITQASIEMADDDDLLSLMARAGFDQVFVGIETPDENSLQECSKFQNKNRDMIAGVKKIQGCGIQVHAGFIVGFDSDPKSIFDTQIKFIQQSGIATAMVSLLNILPKTKLYWRLKDQDRLTKEFSGDNTDFNLNFVPKMGPVPLLEGYRKIVKTIYSPRNYYRRVRTFLREYRPVKVQKPRFSFSRLAAFASSIVVLGLWSKERFQYWGLVFWTLFKRPRLFPTAITMTIYGYHFRKVFHC
ncbi:MAG: B12-binding domain-containing radical SAM protein [Candidatus Edwardsbacteria bacterium RIFOXYD12_FULL_50_11]|uniref:B12-binding domain-containing radical SAM protein n=1 Tax=Candidatus Edwardsbacteria bacterium GWF2_54_11 TaxID=1817851 RepID=A0A1F5R9W0_9BACT|nr:MAG: B12-binding domain-containing radical SAM protein [Candidatus Edwardsbacteria bacterium RifOxyC12_full_54_24]OGF06612.1 MAG: B12-binding domain-containing radical SAM protein [Candidatus Edwardsbacteria bacterium RifOxyA12_full_54_48]OGF11220.1 MAG: B12-binding domain-containing radical SAM protein [Candidatus Edwardsbacteria bacterium GWF2_54_11]OGF11685.1 MAG: B12-binding domain-containing radical SAM protein [Candidatus Edwardsbacteria bacterium GWE2_54_12]OGF17929.1 MAG: B12-binding